MVVDSHWLYANPYQPILHSIHSELGPIVGADTLTDTVAREERVVHLENTVARILVQIVTWPEPAGFTGRERSALLVGC